MGNSFGNEDLMGTDGNPNTLPNPPPPLRVPQMISLHLWSLAYITHSPEMLEAASIIDEERVSELFASSRSTSTPGTPVLSSISQLRAPPMAPYDGKPSNLRAFYSQLVD
ncbi:hypothetical protein K3495_g3311 [Podosphaera aphanis]|nr:hypothetical protein K3495_g3311 [Podosphaera aphanis]